MPHYYFDTYLPDREIIDDIGLEFGSIDDVRLAAVRSMGELAMDMGVKAQLGPATLTVRDSRGKVLLCLTAAFCMHDATHE